jgi:cell division protein FtsL
MEFLQALLIVALLMCTLYVFLMQHIERWLDSIFRGAVGEGLLTSDEIQEMAWTGLRNKK